MGEYKLALDGVSYKVYEKGEKGVLELSREFTSDNRVCEVDFAVTDHYMIQRSPYGAIKSNSPLKAYKTIRGDEAFDSAFKNQIKGSDYAVPRNMAKLFNTFKNKYQRLAKSV